MLVGEGYVEDLFGRGDRGLYDNIALDEQSGLVFFWNTGIGSVRTTHVSGVIITWYEMNFTSYRVADVPNIVKRSRDEAHTRVEAYAREGAA